MQHDQAVGLHHRAENTGALVTGDGDFQAAVSGAAHDATLVFGAPRLLANRLCTARAQQWRRTASAAHHLQQCRAHEGQKGHHHCNRVSRQSEQNGAVPVCRACCNTPDCHGSSGAHRNTPERHATTVTRELVHHGLGVVGLANTHPATGDDGIGPGGRQPERGFQQGWLIAHHAQVNHLHAQARQHAKHGVAVAVVNRAFARCFSQAQDLVAG